MARRWLPEFFEGFEVDPEHLRAYRRVGTVHVEADTSRLEPDAREDEALDCLADPRSKRRIRGLSLLADVGDPDLFDWCVMFLDDEAVGVRIAALGLMLRCEDGDAEVIEPLAASESKRVRAAAIAALARHAGDDAPRWFERGLKDPSPCVRIATARLLSQLDPPGHRPLFELALYDPNPEVVRVARKLTTGKGYPETKW